MTSATRSVQPLPTLEEALNASSMGFAAWRDTLWAQVAAGGSFRDAPLLYRAMSAAEFTAAQSGGAFHSLDGGPLYVTRDADRLAGGAYGAKNGGVIVAFDPATPTVPVPSRHVAGLMELGIASGVSFDAVRGAWQWDAVRRDHLPIAIPVPPTAQAPESHPRAAAAPRRRQRR